MKYVQYIQTKKNLKETKLVENIKTSFDIVTTI